MFRFSTLCVGVLALALTLVLAQPTLAAEAKGTVKTINADKHEFVMADANAKDWTIHLDKDSKVFINDKESKLSDLQGSDEVTVTYEKQGDRLMASRIECKRK